MIEALYKIDRWVIRQMRDIGRRWSQPTTSMPVDSTQVEVLPSVNPDDVGNLGNEFRKQEAEFRRIRENKQREDEKTKLEDREELREERLNAAREIIDRLRSDIVTAALKSGGRAFEEGGIQYEFEIEFEVRCPSYRNVCEFLLSENEDEHAAWLEFLGWCGEVGLRAASCTKSNLSETKIILRLRVEPL